ncbi:hypothetical protein EVAR_63144_1 [Eumeta japonica]|uniref:Uncharacterized protein n=1 Tax=Eumeta variegata TaxID=151549 RepID=A0A4C2AAN1_EUMVA|nr:hypothetical protein EVAR_63144_1 [Eumeta japonica]
MWGTLLSTGSSRGPCISATCLTLRTCPRPALTEWRDGEETWYSTLQLDLFYTVFQEMVTLQRAIRRVKNGKDGLINIFSNSRSSLERSLRKAGLCACSGLERMPEPRVTSSPGGRPHQEDGSGLQSVFAVASEKVIRAVSLEEWQQRYAEGSTGEITKCFFSQVEQA